MNTIYYIDFDLGYVFIVNVKTNTNRRVSLALFKMPENGLIIDVRRQSCGE